MKHILREVAKRFIIGNPVKIAQRFEGQSITEGNCYLLGCRAGPEKSISHLFHEMCHLAEREKRVIKQRPFTSWGFKRGKPWSIGWQSGFEPQTDQQVMREARVWAYQLSLQREFDIDESAFDLCRSAVYLPAFCHFQYGRVNLRKEEDAIQTLASIVEYMSETYTYEKFVKEWNSRMEILKL